MANVTRTCKIDGCDREHEARGWCSLHYARWRRNGDPIYVQRRTRERCSVEGCNESHDSRGWCTTHYSRWRRHGDPLHVTRAYVKRSEWDGRCIAVIGGVRCPGDAINRKCCYTHYEQLRKGEPFTWPKVWKWSYVEVADGHKRCVECREAKPLTQFAKRLSWRDGYCSRCRPCEYRYNRNRQMKTTYGISLADYEAMLAEQGGGCAICGKQHEEPHRGRAYFCVDHCHETGRVRGILCPACNTTLGRMGDDAGGIRRALRYLEKQT